MVRSWLVVALSVCPGPPGTPPLLVLSHLQGGEGVGGRYQWSIAQRCPLRPHSPGGGTAPHQELEVRVSAHVFRFMCIYTFVCYNSDTTFLNNQQ
jgi:hypothetical protein